MLEYYWVLRSVLRERPEVRRCLCRCRHCRIFFITDPRNAGRKDLGCPFGCNEAHRKRESTRRSVAYYRSPKGKDRKRLLNRKRYLLAGRGPESPVAEQASEPEPEPEPDEPEREPQSAAESPSPVAGVAQVRACWSAELVEHVRLVCSLIEGRRVRRKEVLEMLGEISRQRRMVKMRKVDHFVAWLHQQPP